MQKSLLCIFLPLLLCSFAAYESGYTPAAIDMNLCKTGYNGQVQAGDIFRNGNIVGSIIAINRTSKSVKAKYFAFKENGLTVHQRYDQWRTAKNPVLISSGAYSTGFNNTDIPVGLTVDNGNLVNNNYDQKMDALVIVEDVGGVRISNIEDATLKINYNGKYENVDIRNAFQRQRFLDWSKSVNATVFQTHLLIFDNKVKVASNSSTSQSERRLLIMAKDNSGQLFHMVLYSKSWSASLAEIANYTLSLLNSKGYQVLSAINLDTGGIDVLSTSTQLSDCAGTPIVGRSNTQRQALSNMLVYFTE